MVLECDALTNYLIFVNALHNTTQLPVTLWQIPVGRINSTTAISPYTNAKFPDLTNTTQNYEDSASTYFFGDTFTTTGTRATYFGTTDGGQSLVSTSGSNLTWGSHFQLARDAGVTVALFGPGVGDSTDNVGSGESYYWISKAQNYYKNPIALVSSPVGIPLPADTGGGTGGNTGGSTGGSTGGGTDSGSASVAASFAVVSDWGSGYTANVTLTNNGTASVTGWTVSFDLGVPITSFWSAKGSQSGTKATFTNESWNGVIAPGKSVTFGVQTSSSTDKTARTSSSTAWRPRLAARGEAPEARRVRPAAPPAVARRNDWRQHGYRWINRRYDGR